MASLYTIELFDKKQHDATLFDCGISELNVYLKEKAGQESRKKVTAVYIMHEKGEKRIIGYYTLSSYAIELSDLPDDISKKLPKYPLLPAILLGRLAIDNHFQGKKIGGHLLIDALLRSERLSREIGAIAVIVDAKDTRARSFYEKYNFKQFPEHPSKLYLPINTIRDLLSE